MDDLLKSAADALWGEVLAHAGMLERRALSKRKELFYDLIGKHFGPAYAELAAAKGGRA